MDSTNVLINLAFYFWLSESTEPDLHGSFLTIMKYLMPLVFVRQITPALSLLWPYFSNDSLSSFIFKFRDSCTYFHEFVSLFSSQCGLLCQLDIEFMWKYRESRHDGFKKLMVLMGWIWWRQREFCRFVQGFKNERADSSAISWSLLPGCLVVTAICSIVPTSGQQKVNGQVKKHVPVGSDYS